MTIRHRASRYPMLSLPGLSYCGCPHDYIVGFHKKRRKAPAMLKKRAVAVVLMVLMILAAVYLGTFKSLKKLEHNLETDFLQGVDRDGFSIQNDLDIIVAQCYDLLTVSKNYVSTDNEDYRALENARTQLQTAVTVAEKSQANDLVYSAFGTLYFKVKDDPAITDTHKRLIAQYYTEVQSRRDTIRGDGYNESARRFNDILSQFPVNLIYPLTGISKASTF